MSAPQQVWAYASFASIGGFMFGFDTGSIGAITVMEQFENDIAKLSAVIRGLLVSIMLITFAASGLFAGAISDRISRIYTIAIGALFFAIGSILSASSFGIATLFVGRAIAGIGEGLFLSSATVYCIEISPKNSRGRIVSCLQIGVVFGICIGFFTCYGTVHIPSSWSWRIPFVIQSILSTIYGIGMMTCVPFSPRWLHYRGRVSEAQAVLESLSRAGMEGEKEAFEVVNEENVNKNLHWTELFHHGVRERTVLACFLLAMQQLSGIDAVLYYAPTVFKQAGLGSTQAAFLASGVSGLAAVVTTLAVLPFMDRIGRRSSTIIGGVVMGALMLCIVVIYSSGAYRRGAKWGIIAALYLFLVTYCCTWSMVMRLYASEIQPLRTRAAVSSIANAINQATNCLVALTIPIFLQKTLSGPYWLFTFCLLSTSIVAWLTMPETKNLGFDEINKAFIERKSKSHLNSFGGREVEEFM